ncbi:MAG: glycosyltransferase [Chlorobiaceae bacterium]
MVFSTFDPSASLFLEAARITEPLGWVGHMPFAFWITEAVKPAVFVELGTHTGNSYFSFCQSVAANRLPTSCYAVDTWEGDHHASFYGNDVFVDVDSYNSKHYHGFSHLLRMTFDHALVNFSDGSIDLLHIDGLHTYEAVRHDFENWLPKMSSRGIVLFHDINVLERDFGVWKFWEEVSARYPHIAFDHSHGLGVLLVGHEQNPVITALVYEFHNKSSQDIIKSLFARTGRLAELEYRTGNLSRDVADRDLQINAHSLALAGRDEQINALSLALADRDAQINALSLALAGRDEKVNALSLTVGERNEQINTLSLAVADRDAQINKIINSSSWRMTKPVRKLTKSVKKRLRKLRNLFTGNIKDKKGGEYENWIDRYDSLTEEKITTLRTKIDHMTQLPLISVLMPVYNPSPIFLEEAILSVKKQIYQNWELCIADDNSTDKRIQRLIKKHANSDPRIKYTFRTQNGHISAASNSALEIASGDYTALLDHDDLLTPNALYWIANEIINYPDSALIYSDEDKLNEKGKRCDPYFKCDFNYGLLLSHNMISHLGTYKTSLLRQLGGFREGFEGSQDYDVALRMIEILDPHMIRHIPKVLYHWRVHKKSNALSGDNKPYAHLAALKAINEHLQRMDIAATAEAAPEAPGMNRVRYHLPVNPPEVEIIILTRDKPALIQACIKSILKQTTYPNYSITIVDNGSEEQETHDLFSAWKQHHRISVFRDDSGFNFSRLNNKAIEHSKAEFICMMNNDITIISPRWLDEMMGHALQAGVGAVGARLWYPNETLQHGGVILGMGGIAGHTAKHIKKGDPGYFGRACLQQDFSAVTAACLLVRKAHYLSVGGFDENNLTVAFNDVDFCLKLGEKGLRNLWTPYAEMYHHESASRGYENTPEKQARHKKEIEYMKKRWGRKLLHDQSYSPNLSLENKDFLLAWPPRVNIK